MEGMGYAIPISNVTELISQLMTQTADTAQTSVPQQTVAVAPSGKDGRPSV